MTTETEIETHHAEALALRDRLIDVHRSIGVLTSINKGLKGWQQVKFDGKSEADLKAEELNLLIDILLLRQGGSLPYALDTSIEFHPAEGEIHPFSGNVFFVEIDKAEKIPKPKLRIALNLLRLRRPGIIDDSEQAVELLVPYDEESEDSAIFVHRSINEVKAVFKAFDASRDENERVRLAKLKDKIIIERFVEGFVEGMYKESLIDVQIENNGDGVRIFIFDKGKRVGKYDIPGPESANFSMERNRKLAELLDRIGKTQQLRRVDTPPSEK